MRRLIIAVITLLTIGGQWLNAKRIIISADTKVFETAVAKDEYCAVNSNDEPVILLKGMAFPVNENKSGWYVIEYSPGLRGMITTNVVADASSISAPNFGVFTVNNSPKDKVTVTKQGDGYILKSADKEFKGDIEDNVVIFKNKEGAQIYSLTIQDGKPVVYDYSNSVTKFF